MPEALDYTPRCGNFAAKDYLGGAWEVLTSPRRNRSGGHQGFPFGEIPQNRIFGDDLLTYFPYSATRAEAVEAYWRRRKWILNGSVTIRFVPFDLVGDNPEITLGFDNLVLDMRNIAGDEYLLAVGRDGGETYGIGDIIETTFSANAAAETYLSEDLGALVTFRMFYFSSYRLLDGVQRAIAPLATNGDSVLPTLLFDIRAREFNYTTVTEGPAVHNTVGITSQPVNPTTGNIMVNGQPVQLGGTDTSNTIVTSSLTLDFANNIPGAWWAHAGWSDGLPIYNTSTGELLPGRSIFS